MSSLPWLRVRSPTLYLRGSPPPICSGLSRLEGGSALALRRSRDLGAMELLPPPFTMRPLDSIIQGAENAENDLYYNSGQFAARRKPRLRRDRRITGTNYNFVLCALCASVVND